MPKRDSIRALTIWFLFFGTTLLFPASCLDAVSVPLRLNSREKRQITYAKSNESSSSDEKEDEAEKLEYLEHILPKKPLLQYSIYPGDLSRFFVINNTSNVDESSAASSTQLSNKGNRNRSKRGAYLRDSLDVEAISPGSLSRGGRISPRNPPKPRFSESRRHETYQSIDIPSEMTFSGAGYLRSEDDERKVSSPVQNDFALVGNRRAEEDFQAAFHPEQGRNYEGVQFDDDIRPPGTLANEKTKSEVRNAFQKDLYTDTGSPSTSSFSVLSQKAFRQPMEPFLPSQYSNIAGINPFFYTSPFAPPGQLATAADSTGFDIHESLLKNHRLNTAASNNHVTSTTRQEQSISSKPDTIVNSGEVRKRRRTKRSSYPSESHYQDIEYESKGKASEARNDYRYSPSNDRQDSASGFIPLTGTFEGGALHLSFPYYGRSMTPPYSSSPAMPYNSYGPRRPQSRHYGSNDNYFHPSEARRYSYGILGSGNFEVIRGGVYSGESPRGIGAIAFDDGRASYAGDIFSNYGGTTEIIIDGPIRGFQGFDNFPAHLINALSKHSEITVRGPER